jgi:hypothetical protein
MTVKFDNIRCEFEYTDGVWTNVYDDIVGGIKGSKSGIRGYGPLDRVAGTGSLVFTLLNQNNIYTPNHINCTSGFEHGVKFRIVFEYNGLSATKFYGSVEQIKIITTEGLYSYVEVTVLDYMNKLAIHELQRPAYTTNKSIDEIVPLIIANMPVSPLSTEYNSGQDTFTTVFDTTKDKTLAMQELGKLAMSELGYIYIRHNATSDETLVVDGRYTRTGGSIKEVPVLEDINLIIEDGNLLAFEDGAELILDTYTEDVRFDNTARDIGLEYGREYYNEVKTIVIPRKFDTAATSILFDLDRYIQISAGTTKTVTGRFRDPNQEAQTIVGFDMVAPIATTDYLMNTASDGSGTDITADLAVTAAYGANGVEYELTNNGTSLGYVTKLQARGKGVYIYRPVEYTAEYTDGINADGRKTLNLFMPYQDNPLAGESFAEVLLDIFSDKRLVLYKMNYTANRNADLLSAFIFCSEGDRIHIKEDDLEIDGDYIIQSIDFSVTQSGIVFCEYGLMSESLLPASDFWRLGTVGKSELGVTTKLGF